MTHEDFIVEVAKRLDWPEEKTAGIIETILEMVSTELKVNNPVVIDDFGSLKTDIQPEYILVDPETKERYLMPPTMEVVFESLFQENEENSLLRISFTPDEALYDEVNNSFSQFEPTLLNEGIQFPGIPEIVAEEEQEEIEIIESPHLPGDESVLPEPSPEPEITPQPEQIPLSEPTSQSEVSFYLKPEGDSNPIPGISKPIVVQTSRSVIEQQSPPRTRSHRELRSNKRTSSVWIPIAGGIAIVMASLFFFKDDTNR